MSHSLTVMMASGEDLPENVKVIVLFLMKC